jgi:superfamily I DNA/RNA helicase
MRTHGGIALPAKPLEGSLALAPTWNAPLPWVQPSPRSHPGGSRRMPHLSGTKALRLRRVLAGPGSGKTRLLTNELKDRLLKGMPAHTMIGLTFTRRAATEMRQRLGKSGQKAPRLGTFHALSYRILADLGLLPSPLNLDALIPQAIAALRTGRVPAWIPPVQFMAVDEAQDLDATQVEFLQELCCHMTEPELLLVGDPDQAIYGFRQASAAYLLQAESTFAQPCKTILLAENYRSAKTIVELARRLLSPTADPQAPCHSLSAKRPEAHPAIRWIATESPEAEAVRIFEEIRTLLALHIPAGEIAILVRIRAQMPALETEATRWNIPVFQPPRHDQLEDGQEPPPPAPDAIQLMTMHQSKGCEFTCVFLAGVQEGLMPYRRAESESSRYEELRLLYVAVTRAKQLLWLCRHGAPSPFLAPVSGSREPRATGTPTPRPQSWLQWLAQYFSEGKGT